MRLELDDLEEFLDELPTNPCGEGGCGPCDLAFHRSCDPILSYPYKPSDGVPKAEFEAEERTELDIRTTFSDEMEYQELGGEG